MPESRIGKGKTTAEFMSRITQVQDESGERRCGPGRVRLPGQVPTQMPVQMPVQMPLLGRLKPGGRSGEV